MKRAKNHNNEDADNYDEKDAWQQAIFENGDEEVDDFDDEEKDDEFDDDEGDEKTVDKEDDNNNGEENNRKEEEKNKTAAEGKNNKMSDSSDEPEAVDEEKEIAHFDQFLSPDSLYTGTGIRVNIPKEMRHWQLQWERFKNYVSILADPNTSARVRNDTKNYYILELLPLIKKITNHDFPTFLNNNTAEEFLQQGFLGVTVGMKNYDPDIAPPIQYFTTHIRHYLQTYVQTYILKSTRSDESNATKIARAKRLLIKKGVPEEQITSQMLSQMTGIAVSYIEELLAAKGISAISIDDSEHPIMAAATDPETDPVKALEQKCLRELIENEMEDSLSFIEKEVVMFRVYDQIKPTEIAQRLDLPVTEINSIYERARAKLEANGKLRAAYGKKIPERNRVSESIQMISLGINKKDPLSKFFTQDDIEDDE